jgi:hypothetical protein
MLRKTVGVPSGWQVSQLRFQPQAEPTQRWNVFQHTNLNIAAAAAAAAAVLTL